MKLRVKFLITFILIISMASVQSISAEPKLENRIIIFDEGHLQYYTYDYFMSAMSNLNEAFDTALVNYEFEIIINEGEFNSSNLQGADLLIISNTGFVEDFNLDDYETEKGFVNTFVRNGGGVLYMSNPVTDNETLSGHAEILEALKINEFTSEIVKGAAVSNSDSTSVIIDDLNNDGNFSHINLTGDSIQSDTLKLETNQIEEIIYYGAAIEDPQSNYLTYGNTSNTAYPVGKEFEIVESQISRTKWMTAQEIGDEGGRAMIIGSTIMFTNTSYNETTSWIDVGDHRELFENMLAWLANITPLNKPLETVDRSFGSLLGTNLFAAILVSAGLIGFTFFILIKRNTISPSKVFNVKVERKGTSKSEKGASSESSTDSKTTKKQKQRRRRT